VANARFLKTKPVLRLLSAAATRALAVGMVGTSGVPGAGTAAQPAATAVLEADLAATTSSGWLHTSGGRILTSANTPYVIKATNWFGLETAECAPHGLWSISLEQGLKQIKGMGFNTLRLPFSNECLAKTSTSSINYTLNPGLKGRTPLQVMDSVIAGAKAQGMNVILDRHRPDSAAQSALWYTSQYTEARWIADWKMLAARYKSNSTVIGMDLHNEPRGNACWGCGDAATDWRAAATRAGDAILAVNSNLLGRRPLGSRSEACRSQDGKPGGLLSA
jgi:endoglucanase